MAIKIQDILNKQNTLKTTIPDNYLETPYLEAKKLIKNNLNNMAKSFVAIGFYLKHIKEKELYKQDGYKTIWEFARGECGLGITSASRCMKMNDMFSVGGNSPITDNRFKDFNKSQLQEIMYIPKEEEVTPEMTIKEIRSKRKKEEQESEPQCEGQIDISYYKHVLPVKQISTGNAEAEQKNSEIHLQGVKEKQFKEELYKDTNVQEIKKNKDDMLQFATSQQEKNERSIGRKSVIKLKPCPFCGEAAELRRHANPKNFYSIKCTECGCGTDGTTICKITNTDPENKELNAAAWNRRTEKGGN